MSVDRLLAIVLILLNKGNLTGQDLADHFEVSLRTIYRDIEKICVAGVPVASVGGKGGGYYIMEDYNLEKLFLSRSEAGTLIPILSSLGSLMGSNQSFNYIVQKLEKMRETTADNLKIDLSHFSMKDELKECLALASRAIAESRELVFNYINRNKEYSERVVEPIQITLSYGDWYLVSFCKLRNDYRWFKLVRIRNLKLGSSFAKREITPEELDKIHADSYAKRSITVRLKFSESIGEQLPEYFAKGRITKQGDGSYCVEDDYPHEEGLIKHILSFGADCEVLGPDQFRKEVRNYIQNMLRTYNH